MIYIIFSIKTSLTSSKQSKAQAPVVPSVAHTLNINIT